MIKNAQGKEILNPEALCYKAARKIKSDHEEILLIADLALDPTPRINMMESLMKMEMY